MALVLSSSPQQSRTYDIIIIDSIAALLSPILGYGQKEGYILMDRAIDLLRTLGRRWMIPVIVINNAVSNRNSKSGDAFDTMPALGAKWALMPTSRLYFTKTEVHFAKLLKLFSTGSGVVHNEDRGDLMESHVHVIKDGKVKS